MNLAKDPFERLRGVPGAIHQCRTKDELDAYMRRIIGDPTKGVTLKPSEKSVDICPSCQRPTIIVQSRMDECRCPST
jgi:hypothetical protein